MTNQPPFCECDLQSYLFLSHLLIGVSLLSVVLFSISVSLCYFLTCKCFSSTESTEVISAPRSVWPPPPSSVARQSSVPLRSFQTTPLYNSESASGSYRVSQLPYPFADRPLPEVPPIAEEEIFPSTSGSLSSFAEPVPSFVEACVEEPLPLPPPVQLETFI